MVIQKSCFAVAFTFVWVASAAAQTVSYTLADENAKRQITFESRAPVEYIEGYADGISGTIVADISKPNLDLQAIVSVPVSRMQTGNDIRDDHMHSAAWLNAEKYPGIRFELKQGSATLAKKSDGVWTGKADGLFTLKGVTRQVSVPIVIKQKDKKLLVNGRFMVHLEDYGVNGPIGIKMIGVKVGQDVSVNVNLQGVQDPGWDNLVKKRR